MNSSTNWNAKPTSESTMTPVKRIFTAQDLKFLVGNGARARFTRFVSSDGGSLWYTTDSGFEFPVPVQETEGATMLAEDKAVLLMRHIRKHLAMLDKAREAELTALQSASGAAVSQAATEGASAHST